MFTTSNRVAIIDNAKRANQFFCRSSFSVIFGLGRALHIRTCPQGWVEAEVTHIPRPTLILPDLMGKLYPLFMKNSSVRTNKVCRRVQISSH